MSLLQKKRKPNRNELVDITVIYQVSVEQGTFLNARTSARFGFDKGTRHTLSGRPRVRAFSVSHPPSPLKGSSVEYGKGG